MHETKAEDIASKSINDGKTEFERISIPVVTALTLPDIFKDDMLFDADKPVIIWGLSPYLDKVEIVLLDKSGQAVRTATVYPAQDKSFVAEFEGVAPSFEEYTLEIKAGEDSKEVKNILFGRLYLAGGQSNMDMIVRDIYNKNKILTAQPNPYIRIYTPAVAPCDPENCAMTPVFSPERGGPWVSADDLEALKDVTAVGLVFAKGMFEKHSSDGEQVPVGILSTSHGGTVIETWMSRQSFEQDAALKKEMLVNKVWANEGDKVVAEQLKKQGYNNTTVLYNMKIAPIANMKISGFIWYQGESQVGKSMSLFAKELDTFIKEYTRIFRCGKSVLPTVLVNVTPFLYEEAENDREIPSGGARVNETFNEIAARYPTALVSMPTYDFSLRYDQTEVWEPNPIHPSDKIPLAQRAVEMFWGLTHDNFVPLLNSFKIEAGKIIAECSNTYEGLVSPNKEAVKGFRICGADRKFYPAQATIIDKNKVLLSSAKVQNPAAFSYAFCNMNNEANLFNSRGIPVQIFRTDKEAHLKPE
ncbi:MAG TPA: sialate O-acetylesterase [Clostridia bacterium]|nr:sialate O-acetylesterase [Clostridia bacterium]